MGCGRCRQKTKIKVNTSEVLKAPVLRSDGVIQFPEGQTAPLVAGYTVDERDERLLNPDEDCSCNWKMTGIMLNKDGTYAPHHVCVQSKCEQRSKPVSVDICKACPFRELALNSPG